MPEPELLAVHDLHAGYGAGDVLQGVSLTLPRACITALTGPNGHGKSTLLKTISGLLRPRGGHVVVAGQDVTGLAPERIAARGVAHVPQGDALFMRMTVAENLLLGATLVRGRAARAARMDQVYAVFPRLAELARRRVEWLSGGERRMVALGRGLVGGRPLLLIDEPALGLAPRVVDDVYAALPGLRAAGHTLLLVDEDAARAAALADHVAVLERGRIAWHGAPGEVPGITLQAGA